MRAAPTEIRPHARDRKARRTARTGAGKFLATQPDKGLSLLAVDEAEVRVAFPLLRDNRRGLPLQRPYGERGAGTPVELRRSPALGLLGARFSIPSFSPT